MNTSDLISAWSSCPVKMCFITFRSLMRKYNFDQDKVIEVYLERYDSN